MFANEKAYKIFKKKFNTEIDINFISVEAYFEILSFFLENFTSLISESIKNGNEDIISYGEPLFISENYYLLKLNEKFIEDARKKQNNKEDRETFDEWNEELNLFYNKCAKDDDNDEYDFYYLINLLMNWMVFFVMYYLEFDPLFNSNISNNLEKLERFVFLIEKYQIPQYLSKLLIFLKRIDFDKEDELDEGDESINEEWISLINTFVEFVQSIIDEKNEITNNPIEEHITLEKIKSLPKYFEKNLVGQNKVSIKIQELLINNLYDDSKHDRPAGVLFFSGPTGVGKTETVKLLSNHIFGNNEFIRIDMSEYKSEVAGEKLTGAGHGYVGFEEGGILTNAIKKKPYSIVLFDEIEKAHKNVFDLFLQILDEGTLTSGNGEKISFKNSIIIFTSNIGSNKINSEMSNEETEKIIVDSVVDEFTIKLNRPEIIGRIGRDNIIAFNLIKNKKDLYKILDILYSKFAESYLSKNIRLETDRIKLYDYILEDVDLTKGARDIRNEFDVFKKHFYKSLFLQNLILCDLLNKVIDFSYNNREVKINKIF